MKPPARGASLPPLHVLAMLGLLLTACAEDRRKQEPVAPEPVAAAPVSATPAPPEPDEPPVEPPPYPERRHREDDRTTEKFPESTPLRKVSPNVLSRLSRSLATVTVDGRSTVAVVVARRGERLTLLAQLPFTERAKVTYRSGSRTQTVSDLRSEGGLLVGSRTVFISAPAPKFPVPPLPVDLPQRLEPGAPLLLARSGAKPFLTPVRVLEQRFSQGETVSFQVDFGAAGHQDGLYIDPVRERVIASVDRSASDSGKRDISAVSRRQGLTLGQLVSGTLTVFPEDGERCRLEGEFALDDPLGNVKEVALSLGAPGEELSWWETTYLPEPRDFVARASVREDGTATLRTSFEPCRAPRYAQLSLHGSLARRWSVPMPLPMPGLGPRSRTVPTRAKHWRHDPPENYPGSAGPPQPMAPSERCKPLDPETVYLLGTGGGRKCETSSLGTGVVALDDRSQARCLGLGSPSNIRGILPDGRLLEEDLGVYRLRAACPRFTHAGGWWSLPVVALDPCGPSAPDILPTFFAPDGGLVFACLKGYADAWGMPVDFDGGTLVRLGAGGRSLVVAPRGGLAVLGADGVADEVLGLAEEACLQPSCPLVSFATDTGFLVALRRGTPDALSGPFHLFEIAFDGQAKDRGALPALPEGVKARDVRLDGKGRLLVPGDSGAVASGAGGADSRLLVKAPAKLLQGPRGSSPSELLRPELPPESSATWKYRRPRQVWGECDSRLQRFEPEKVYLFEMPRVWDAHDAAQRSFGIPHEVEQLWMTRDGRLHYQQGKEFRTFAPDDWRRRPGETECAPGDTGERADCQLQPCLEPGDLLRGLVPRPDSDLLVYSCQSRKDASFYLVHEGRRLEAPVSTLVGTGPGGLVLVRGEDDSLDTLHLVKPRGAPVRVSGLPEGMRLWTTRASATGIDLVLAKQPSWHEPPTEAPELWTLEADGKASRIGVFPEELISGGKRPQWMRLTPQRGLYASYQKPDGSTDEVVRAELGEGTPQVLFTGTTNYRRRAVTGP